MKDNVYVYDYEGKTYINLTNRCNNACDFCIRKNEVGIEGYNLWLNHDAKAEDVIKQLKENGKLGADVVFCGYGEPTMNLDTLIEVARFVKQNGAKTRLNTNGLASAHYDRDVAAMLKDVIDEMSISLNDSDAKKYDDICHSRFGLNAYGYMLDFARDCVKYGIKTILTVVDVIPKENIEKCAEIAKEVGAIFRVRTYSDK